MANPICIKIDGVSKSFGKITAVKDVSFVVSEGSVTGLLGPNGAGKTTLLRMILGLANPSVGTITYPNRDRDSNRYIGASLNGGWAAEGLTAAKDWDYAREMLGVSKEKCTELQAFVGLGEEDMKRPVSKFSTGMRQRHGLGIALLGDPKVLVLDEPLNGLDPEGIRWMRAVIDDLATRGVSILLSSHLLSEVEHVAEDLVIINRTVRFTGTLAELKRQVGEEGDLEHQYFALLETKEGGRS